MEPLPDHVVPRRVIIVGGGFAGLFAARWLKRAPVEVTVVDRSANHVFQPLPYQYATGIVAEGQITPPQRQVLARQENCRVLLMEVTGFDVERRGVLAQHPDGTAQELRYDYLILGPGVGQPYFGNEAIASYAPGMKTIDDAPEIRRRVFDAFEMAELASDREERRAWPTFAVVGAGAGRRRAGRADPRARAPDTPRRVPRHAHEHGPRARNAVAAVLAPRPRGPDLAEPRPLHPLRRPRVDAALLSAPPGRACRPWSPSTRGSGSSRSACSTWRCSASSTPGARTIPSTAGRPWWRRRPGPSDPRDGDRLALVRRALQSARHELFDFDAYALAGDGCVTEKVSNEAAPSPATCGSRTSTSICVVRRRGFAPLILVNRRSPVGED